MISSPPLPSDGSNKLTKIILNIFLGLVLIFIVLKIFGKNIESYLFPVEKRTVAELQQLETDLLKLMNNSRCDLASNKRGRNAKGFRQRYEDAMAEARGIQGPSVEFNDAIKRAKDTVEPMIRVLESLPICNLNCGTDRVQVYGTDYVSNKSLTYCIPRSALIPTPIPIPSPTGPVTPPGPTPPGPTPPGPTPPGPTPPGPTGVSAEIIMRLNTLGNSLVKCIRPSVVSTYLGMLEEAKVAPKQPQQVVDALANVIIRYKNIKGVCDVISTQSKNDLQKRGESNTWVTKDGVLWLFGGNEHTGSISGSIAGVRNDMWKNENGVWSMVFASIKPSARTKAVTWIGIDGNLWLYGGKGANGELYSDMWKWNLNTNNWEVLDGTTAINLKPDYVNLKPGTSTVPSSYAHVNGKLWLLIRTELWHHNGQGWSLLSNDQISTVPRKPNVVPKFWLSNVSNPVGSHPMWVDKMENVYVYVSSDCATMDQYGRTGNVEMWMWSTDTWKLLKSDQCSDNYNPGYTVGVPKLTWKDTDDNLYIFVDRSGEGYDKIWKWNTNAWELVSNSELIAMTGRSGFNTWNIGSQLYVYGGQFTSATPKYTYGSFPSDLLVVSV